MSQLQHIKLQILDREIAFALELDPETFIQDRNLLHCLRVDGCCEPEIVHVMFRVIKPGDFVIDAGAAVGFFSLLMAQLVGKDGKVLAIEPGPNNIPKLEQNIRINRLNQIYVCKQPLWNICTKLPFHVMEDSGDNSLAAVPGFKSSPILQTTSLFGLLRIEQKLPRLLKVDCEGAEYQIMRGMAQCPPLAIPYILMELNRGALHRFDVTPENVCITMMSYGYDLFSLHKDGVLPTWIPPEAYPHLKFNRANTMVLFSTKQKVLEAWPEIHL